MEVNEEEPFRVYSERQIEASHFKWSPHMDLMAWFTQESSNPSVAVWRLINDKQTNSPLLFTEKIPFPGTSLAWVPDKRSLTVGDSAGNVFVYDAERQRTIELQKVHDAPISHVDWLDLGLLDSRFTSNHHKLPPISQPASSISSVVGDQPSAILGSTNPDTDVAHQSPIQCDTLAFTDRVTFMTVLGLNGQLSMYYGGSIPIAEIALPNAEQTAYISAHVSPDLSNILVVSESGDSCRIDQINSGIVKLRKNEIIRLARIETRIHWLLKLINIGVDVIQRAVVQSIDEYHGLVDGLLNNDHGNYLHACLFGQENMEIDSVGQITMAKTVKISRSTLNCIDYLTITLSSNVGIQIDHLSMAITELVDPRFAFLGIPIDVTRPLLEQVSGIRKKFYSLLNRLHDQSRLFKVLFSRIEKFIGGTEPLDSLIANLKTPLPCDAVIKDLADRTSSTDLGDLLSLRNTINEINGAIVGCKRLEEMYLSLLSYQRRVIGRKFLFGPTRASMPKIIRPVQVEWTCSDEYRMTWVNDGNISIFLNGKLHVYLPPERAKFLFSQFYRNGRLCVVLKHPETVSIATIDVSVDTTEDSVSARPTAEIVVTHSPDEYGLKSVLLAQQLPPGYMDVTGFEVSPSRGICSIYSAGRMITLDLEPDDDDVGGESGSHTVKDDYSMASVDEERRPLTRTKSWIDENKFFNADGRAIGREKIKKSPRDSPDFEFF
jgi:hypothetical protein